jgi:hypothetical protein
MRSLVLHLNLANFFTVLRKMWSSLGVATVALAEEHGKDLPLRVARDCRQILHISQHVLDLLDFHRRFLASRLQATTLSRTLILLAKHFQ